LCRIYSSVVDYYRMSYQPTCDKELFLKFLRAAKGALKDQIEFFVRAKYM
jgi:hypothetical protein